MCGNPWKYPETLEDIWRYSEIFGDTWNYDTLRYFGNPWRFVETWRFWEIHGQ